MDITQYEQSGVAIQLFSQPSLSSVYLRNNRSLMNNDFILAFPAIPMSFGLSSDLASGWSKLVHEQSLLNQKDGNQQKTEVEILGLGASEAHVVEECVKLLFGFRVHVTKAEVWIFLKVADMLGLTQSPLGGLDGLTVQEQLLKHARECLSEVNVVEAWDYVVGILEGTGDAHTIHRTEIRALAYDIYQQVKESFSTTNFENLAQYYTTTQQKVQVQGCPSTHLRFTMADLKRENYIQIRTQFYAHVNKQVMPLTATQGIVKVLLDDLDRHFELDGFINKQMDTIGTKIDDLNLQLTQQQLIFEQALLEAKEDTNRQTKQLKEKQHQLESELRVQKQRSDALINLTVVCSHRTDQHTYLGISNGCVEVIDHSTQQSYIIPANDAGVCCIMVLLQWTFLGMSDGRILQLSGRQHVTTIQRTDKGSSGGVQCMMTHKVDNIIQIEQNKLLIACYGDGSIVGWDALTSEMVYDSCGGLQQAPCGVAYSHAIYGDFIIFGDDEGCIKFTYFSEQKQRPTLDLIKQMKNGSSAIVAITHLADYLDMVLTSQRDQCVCVWNWESETLLTIIKLDSVALNLFSLCHHDARLLVCLLHNGQVQLYQFDKDRQATFKHQQQATTTPPICMAQCDEQGLYAITSQDGKSSTCRIQWDPLNLIMLSHHRLHLQCTLSHHTSCVYALAVLAYPLFASSSDDTLIKIFNVSTHEVTQTLKGHQAYVRAIALLQGSNHLLSASYDSSVKVWDLVSGACLNTLTGHTKPVLAVQVVHHTELVCLSGGEDAVIKAWNWKLAICIWMIEMQRNEVWSLQSVTNTTTYGVLTGHKDGQLKFINIGQKGEQCLQEREMKIHKSFINNIVILNDHVVATASSDNLIAIVDWLLGTILRTLKGHHDIVWHLDRIDEHRIVSSSTEGNIKLWNWKTGVCLNTSICSKGSIYTLLKLPESKKLLCGTATGDIMIWKIVSPFDLNLSKIIT